MTSSIIETMMNIRTTPMSMKTVMKKRRRKTEEEKKEKLMNMSKMKKLMKTRERGDLTVYWIYCTTNSLHFT